MKTTKNFTKYIFILCTQKHDIKKEWLKAIGKAGGQLYTEVFHSQPTTHPNVSFAFKVQNDGTTSQHRRSIRHQHTAAKTSENKHKITKKELNHLFIGVLKV